MSVLDWALGECNLKDNSLSSISEVKKDLHTVSTQNIACELMKAYIGLAKMFFWIFPQNVTGKPKQKFWPTQQVVQKQLRGGGSWLHPVMEANQGSIKKEVMLKKEYEF